MNEIIQGMHQHTPIQFYSDAQENPVLTKCSECGETLDVSAALLEEQYGDKPLEVTGVTLDDSKYADRSHRGDGSSGGRKYLGMTENGTQYTP